METIYKGTSDFYIGSKNFAKPGDIIDFRGSTILNCTRGGTYSGLSEEAQKLLYKDLEKVVKNKENSVDHPDYYNENPSGIECIDVIRHYPFNVGCAIKYLWRAGLKKDASLSDKEKEIEDLKKAIWYIEDRIKQLSE